MISRDVFILIGFAVLFFITGHSIAVRPTFVGKVCTFFQLLTITLTLVSLHNPAWRFPLLWHSTVTLAGGATTVSGLQYLSRALLWLNQQDTEQPLNAGGSARSNPEEKGQRYSA